VQSAAATGTDS